MVYTVTLNPTLDYALTTGPVVQGEVNRASGYTLHPGGKGLTVSIMLGRLGIKTCAMGFVAGFTGDELCRLLRAEGVDVAFLPLAEGMTRITVLLHSHAGSGETEFHTPGPGVPREEFTRLMDGLAGLTQKDWLVLAGSLPPGVPEDTYKAMLEAVAKTGAFTVVDTTCEALWDVLPLHPFLIKPNIHELSALLGEDLRTAGECAAAARKLQKQGARNILVSMGGTGAVLVAEDGSALCAAAPKGEVASAVGSGDSAVAGFITAMENGGGHDAALQLAVAAGSASAFAPWLASGNAVQSLYASGVLTFLC